MTFIKVRRQLTREGEREEARGLQTKPPPQPRNLIQYKSPGIKLFRLMARQTNVVETRLRLYNRDQHPRRSAIPQRSLPYTIRSSRATPTAITISVATDTTTTIPGQILRQFDRKEGRESTPRKRPGKRNLHSQDLSRQLYSELKKWQS